MEHRWVHCTTCSRPFVPRFAYQTHQPSDPRGDDEASGDGTSESSSSPVRYYCSIACRNPELREAAGAPAPGSSPERSASPADARALHACAVCGARFELSYAYQLVSFGRSRKVICSEPCRQRLLERHRPPVAAPAPPSTRVVAVLNQKGGTGKTTTSVSVAAGLAAQGQRTLLVDCDAQGSVGASLGVRGQKTLYHVLIDGYSPIQAALEVRPHLEVLISDQTLAAAEIELVNAPNRAHVLSHRMQSVRNEGYDWVILDCAPSLSLLNQNALIFADEVLIPVSCDYLSLVGVKQILRTIKHVNDVLMHTVRVLAVLPTLYDVRNKISRQAVDALKEHFGARVLEPIRINAKLKEAPGHKQTIFEYAPESHGAVDYGRVVGWMLESTPHATHAGVSSVSRARG